MIHLNIKALNTRGYLFSHPHNDIAKPTSIGGAALNSTNLCTTCRGGLPDWATFAHRLEQP
jgi:hypothetical protein